MYQLRSLVATTLDFRAEGWGSNPLADFSFFFHFWYIQSPLWPLGELGGSRDHGNSKI